MTKTTEDVSIQTNSIRSRVATSIDASRDGDGLRTVREARTKLAAALTPPETAEETEDAKARVRHEMPSPFTEDGMVTEIAGMTVENTADRVSIRGQAVYPHGNPGRRRWLELVALLDLIEATLSATEGLPDRIEPDVAAVTAAPNPFG